MNNDDIYQMKLHDVVNQNNTYYYFEIIRVPGGWVYRIQEKITGKESMVFVPYNNEFQDNIV
jgi:hypothetical protein